MKFDFGTLICFVGYSANVSEVSRGKTYNQTDVQFLNFFLFGR